MDIKKNITGLQHVGLPTNDIDKTIEFYKGLGFELVMETYNEKGQERVAFLKLYNYVVETYENHQAVMADGAYQHVALDVKNIEEIYSEICENNYKVVSNGIEELLFWDNGIKYFIIEGPNTEKIEFCQIN
ncbi:MAG: VOC family protein [Clostridia bacterium]|nr:VOC family protein [Clostridia bacterium]